MTDKLKNLVVRSLSGVVLAAAIIGAIVWSPWSFGALMALLTVGGMHEFYRLAERRGVRPQRFAGIAVGVMLVALNFGAVTGCGSENPLMAVFAVALLLALTVPTLFIIELYRKNPDPLAAVGVTLLGVFYVAVPLSCVCYMTGDAAVWSPWVVLGYIFIVWANDVFAYLAGMTFGRHRLFPRLSPKKSWEGFVGGLAGAACVGWLWSRHLGEDPRRWVALALVAAATGVLGDLAESMLKRAAGVKDSGNLIPGHGGVLDRFDAVLLSAPFVGLYLLCCEIFF